MKSRDIYEKLGEHLSCLGMGYPLREELIEILRENLTPEEARICLAIPNKRIPLQPVAVDEIAKGISMEREDLVRVLEDLSDKGLIFSGIVPEGKRGYALQQVGFGFPQTFFWKGEKTDHARKMAGMVAKYFDRKVTQEAYSSKTKPYRYIPVGESVEQSIQAVFPVSMMEKVILEARKIAVAHCPCRMAFLLRGRGCQHPTEVCLKFNNMAEYVIERGFAREITKEEALDIIKRCEQLGLVHFVDNAEGDIQHNCNCCGCACWNVGNFKRRKIPRDVLMETYFIRKTDKERCIGCGQCIEKCPVDALRLEDDMAVHDPEWCIGCGVCVPSCPNEAARLIPRPDKAGEAPAENFWKLHEKILKERHPD